MAWRLGRAGLAARPGWPGGSAGLAWRLG